MKCVFYLFSNAAITHKYCEHDGSGENRKVPIAYLQQTVLKMPFLLRFIFSSKFVIRFKKGFKKKS